MKTMDAENLKKRILAVISEDELSALMEEKFKRLGGLCDEETALMLIAHDLKISSSSIDGLPEKGWVSVDACVISIGRVRTFTRKDGSQGKVASLMVGDEGARLRVVLWDEVSDLVSRGVIKEGVSYTFTGSLRDGELHISKDGNITPLDHFLEPSFEPVSIERLKEIDDGSKVDLLVRVVKISKPMVRNSKRFREVVVGDGKRLALLVLWGDDVEIMEGDTIEVRGAMLRNMRLHAFGGVKRSEKGVEQKEIEQSVKYLTPSKLEDGLVCVEGVLTGIDEERVFIRRDGTQGRRCTIYLSDANRPDARVRLTMWDEAIDLLTDVELGEMIKVMFCLCHENELSSTSLTTLSSI
ncbi:hypothetical protein DRN72_00085 [Methanosarcinales archaeon]|nr:MAG: hypothetical protein DRN72_00085 [Methanosarcinales archaeon]